MKIAKWPLASAVALGISLAGCSGNGSGQSVHNVAMHSPADAVHDAVARADVDVARIPSVAGEVPTLLARREAALGFVNECLESAQTANAGHPGALEQNTALLNLHQRAFDEVDSIFTARIKAATAQLSGRQIPLTPDSAYFSYGKASIEEATEVAAQIDFELKSASVVKGYYRVVVEWLNSSGGVVRKKEAMSARIMPAGSGAVCRFTLGADITDLANVVRARVTVSQKTPD